MKRDLVWKRALLTALAILALAGALCLLALPAPLRADSSPGATSAYTLDWWTVDGGGRSGPAGAGYTLEGTIGQPDAGLWQGGAYTLAGGFWHSAGGPAPELHRVYLPLVTRQP
jgi:hypothetical protein